MSWLNAARARLRALRRREAVLEDIDEELRLHVEMEAEENVKRGMAPGAARFAAMRSFGNAGRIRDAAYEIRGGGTLETLWQDVHFGTRMLVKDKSFSLIAVLILALGIGANTAIFSIVDKLLLRPLPGVDNSSSLVDIGRTLNDSGFETFSYPDYVSLRDGGALSGLAAHHSAPLHLSAGDVAERVPGASVSGNYFALLGVKAARGRLIAGADDKAPGAHPVAVISHGLWRRRFGSDPAVIGRDVSLNSHRFAVIGIVAEEFAGTQTGERVDVWVPLAMQAQARPPGKMLAKLDVYGNRGFAWLRLFGRLESGAGLRRAQEEMDALAGILAATYPDTNKDMGVRLSPGIGFDPETRAGWAGYVTVLIIVVGLVLAVACANVANLLLARSAARRKEFGIRLALGAARRRLVRQLLVESLLLYVAGGVAGLIVAYWATALLPSAFFAPDESLAPVLSVRPDVRLLLFTFAVSLATGLVFGLAPALRGSRVDLVPALKDAEAAAGRGSGRARLRDALVVAQIAVSFALLIAAGLLIRSLMNLRAIDPGFAADQVVVASLDLGLQGYDEERGWHLYQDLVQRVRAQPGVEAVSLARVAPLGGGLGVVIAEEGRQLLDGDRRTQVNFNVVTPDYFRTVRVALLRGRDFGEGDAREAGKVAIINETLARRLFGEQNPVGRRLLVPRPMSKPESVEVIGVARDAKYRSLLEPPAPYMYLPAAQRYDPQLTLHVRTTKEAGGDSAWTLAEVRREVQAVDRNLPVYDAMPLGERLRSFFWRERAAAAIASVCGFVALVLAGSGLYGALSYTVARRTREIGIRMALGSGQGELLKLVLKRGMALAFTGVGIGLAGAFAVTRLMANLLYGVTPADNLTFIGVTALLLAVSLLACLVPARRATKVDPLVALKHD